MDKHKQRIASVVIGLVLAGLLLFIVVRVIQRRASQAAQPESITAERVDAKTCKISAVTSSDEPLLIKYGSTTPTFFYRMQPEQITPQSDGKYLQQAQIDQVGEDQVTFTVENFENISTTCEPFSDAAGTKDSVGGGDILPTVSVEPTREAVVESTPAVVADDKDGLTMEMAMDFYDKHPGAFISACVDEFKDSYMGLAQVCGAAYQEHKSK